MSQDVTVAARAGDKHPKRGARVGVASRGRPSGRCSSSPGEDPAGRGHGAGRAPRCRCRGDGGTGSHSPPGPAPALTQGAKVGALGAGRRSGQPGVESRFRPLQPGPGGGPLNVLTEKTRLAHRSDGLSAGEAGGFGYLPGRFLGVAL